MASDLTKRNIDTTAFRAVLMTATAAALAVLAIVARPASARAGTFSLTGAIDPARQYHSATLLADGKVLVAGGYR